MILSILTGRIPLAVTASVAARTAFLPPLSVVVRRTLFATSQFNFPAAKPSKKARPAKNPAEHEKKEVEKKVKVLKPPKRAPGPYILFFSSFLKSQPKGNSLDEANALAKRASEVWKGYSMAEKQPFYDEYEVRAAQANQEREEFFRNTTKSELKELNEKRKTQNKPKYRSPSKSPKAMTAYLQFYQDFRESSDGQVIMNDTADKKRIIRATIAAGERWRSMSPEEKEPYVERYTKEKEELKAQKAEKH